MDLQKINVKLFVADSGGIPLERFIHVFNAWIQAAEGVYYDVADYSHVPSGPGILLIAHEANISMDNMDNRLGLLYNQKELLQGSNRDKLRQTFKRALEHCRRLEEDPLLNGHLRFLGNEALFLVNDRLIAPNSDSTFHSVRPDLEAVARELYGEDPFDLEPEGDPKRRFAVRIKTPRSWTIDTLLKNIAQ